MWEGNGGAISVANDGVALGGEAGDGERHRDAVIAARLDLRSAPTFRRDGLPPSIRPAALPRTRPCGGDFPPARRSGRSLSLAAPRRRESQSLFRVRAQRSEHRQFVNHQWNLFARDHSTFQ